MIGPGDREAALRARLAAVVEATGPVLDIAEAALLLAALGRPDVDLAPYRAHLARLAAEARGTGSTNAVVELLFGRHGYRGDSETYDDLRNADLAHVIDRRRGLPVALGILTVHAARAAGLAAWGANTPGHFLVLIEEPGGPGLRDPFNGGRAVGAAELARLVTAVLGPDARLDPAVLAPMDDRAVLVRLQNNIKVRAMAAEDADRAAMALGSMVVLAPGDASLWRELAQLEVKRENLRAAGRALEGALAAASAADEARAIELELRRLRARLN